MIIMVQDRREKFLGGVLKDAALDNSPGDLTLVCRYMTLGDRASMSNEYSWLPPFVQKSELITMPLITGEMDTFQFSQDSTETSQSILMHTINCGTTLLELLSRTLSFRHYNLYLFRERKLKKIFRIILTMGLLTVHFLIFQIRLFLIILVHINSRKLCQTF